MLYKLDDRNGQNLIRAVYPSNDATKFFVLCSDENKEETLEKLHHVETIVKEFFESAALQLYFNGEEPIVHHFLKLTDKYSNFVDSLIGLTSAVSSM